jgi:hypothetical protein
MAILFSTEQPIAASVPEQFVSLTQRSKQTIIHMQELSRTTGNIYPFGVTPVETVEVLPPHHFMDLSSWTIHRFWPRGAIKKFPYRSGDQRIQQAISIVKSTIYTVNTRWPVLLNLTGGRDTRMLLASILPDAHTYTFETKSNGASADYTISRAIADTYDLNLNIQLADKKRFALIQGLAGEVGRAFYWKRSDFTDLSPLNAFDVATRAGMGQANKTMIERLESWLSSLPQCDRFLTLDLYYIEHRLGYTMGPAMYGHERYVKVAMYAMNCHTLFEIMLSMPEKFRIQQGFYQAFIDQSAPELHVFPINHPFYTGFDKYRAYLNCLFANYRRVPSRFNRVVRSLNRNRGPFQMITDDFKSIITRFCAPQWVVRGKRKLP